jgi:hypothetical protein
LVNQPPQLNKMKILLHSLVLMLAFWTNEPKNPRDKGGTWNTTIKTVADARFEYKLYDGLGPENVKPIMEHLSQQVERIAADLDVDLDDNKITIHILDKKENYLYLQKVNFGITFPGSTSFIINPHELVILNVNNAKEEAEHELAHALSLNIREDFGNEPRWLWEAVSIYEAREFRDPKKVSYLAEGNFPTIDELNSELSGQTNKIYNVGYVLTDFIVSNYGKKELISLIKNRGKIEDTFGISNAQFEAQWKQYVTKKYL